MMISWELRSLGFKAIEVSTAVLLGLAVWHYNFDTLKLLSMILGSVVLLILTIYGEGLFMRRENKGISDAQRELTILANSPAPMDRRLFNLGLKYSGRKIPAPEVMLVWRDLCWIFEDNYDCTNYVRTEEIYNAPWASPAIAIQIAKSLSAPRAYIRKVFLVDNESELGHIRDSLDSQTRARIAIRYLLHQSIKKKAFLSGLAKELKSTDFGIFDKRCMLIWNLDSRREVVGGELVFDDVQIKKYDRFFDELLAESTQYSISPTATSVAATTAAPHAQNSA
jgi:hypothetical protein